ncbi:hypothetical protein AGMMS50296_4430 [Alphaproteobacteria bacterium]|nr:hypothetical protein AGMMS50296_4430 [Alphaproteobacteria bacterium]
MRFQLWFYKKLHKLQKKQTPSAAANAWESVRRNPKGPRLCVGVVLSFGLGSALWITTILIKQKAKRTAHVLAEQYEAWQDIQKNEQEYQKQLKELNLPTKFLSKNFSSKGKNFSKLVHQLKAQHRVGLVKTVWQGEEKLNPDLSRLTVSLEISSWRDQNMMDFLGHLFQLLPWIFILQSFDLERKGKILTQEEFRKFLGNARKKNQPKDPIFSAHMVGQIVLPSSQVKAFQAEEP